jgi:hypothetical protein
VSEWLVDWDLKGDRPEKSCKRVALWRAIKRLKKELNGHTIKYSSKSVIVSSSQPLVMGIHEAAKRLGAQSSVYQLSDLTLVKRYRPRRPKAPRQVTIVTQESSS